MNITQGDRAARLASHPWLPATRPEVSTAITLQIAQGTALSLRPTAPRRWWLRRPSQARLRLECLAGEVWVTLDDDRADHCLRDGRSLDAPGDRLVVVQAMRPATVMVSEVWDAEP
jgi:hypothetical protein